MSMKRLKRLLRPWKLWLFVKFRGLQALPIHLRLRLWVDNHVFQQELSSYYSKRSWTTQVLTNARILPFKDLLNRPSGGEAYYGGVLFNIIQDQSALRHFRGSTPIDRPIYVDDCNDLKFKIHQNRLFWCGPLAFHFGHQIADFGSRVLLASIDPRPGDLLWYPWRASSRWEDLLPWQKFLLTYLNPGNKNHYICTEALQVDELIVYPQQARMRAYPTAAHLEALCWCEKRLNRVSSGVVYISRRHFAPCEDSVSLKGAYAGELLLETLLRDRGVNVIYPEQIDLKTQLEIYLSATALIIAEGSAQHGLELLGFHRDKSVFVICRRKQTVGMELPLSVRFPKTKFVDAITSLWKANDGVVWNGLAILDWNVVADAINPLLSIPLSSADCCALQNISEEQLKLLASRVDLHSVNLS